MTQELEERFYPNPRAEVLRRLPILHLLRAFRLAIDPRKLLLGAIAAVLLAGGQWLLDRSPLAPQIAADQRPDQPDWPWQAPIVTPGLSVGLFDSVLDRPLTTLESALWEGFHLLTPYRTVIEPGRRLFRFGNSWPDVAYSWTQLLWALAVWGLFGATISRIAAVQFAAHRGPSLRDAVGYAGRRWGSAVSAPLLPLVFLGGFWLVCALVGFVGRIPGIGEAAAGILWFIPLLCGFALAVILLFIAAGWPLMVCTVAVEGTDGFDGLSRSYDYLLSRPWYALGMLLLLLIYGSVAIVFVLGVTAVATHLAEWGVSSGMDDLAVQGLTSGSPPALETGVVALDVPETSLVGRTAVTFWLQLLALLLWGFVYSFFWSSATIAYFLLRLSVDAMPLNRVHVPALQTAGGIPLVGVPAAERAEASRRSAEAVDQTLGLSEPSQETDASESKEQSTD